MKNFFLLIVTIFAFPACTRTENFSYDSAIRPGLSEPDVVAKIAVFKGKVTIETKEGKTIEAKPELALLESDMVKTPADGFALLQLRNGRLTRIDDSVSLMVSNVAGLRLDPVDTPVEQQITRLLSPVEMKETERIVGWHARMSAAKTIRTENEKEPQEAARIPSDLHKAPVSPSAIYKHKYMKTFGGKSQQSAHRSTPGGKSLQRSRKRMVTHPAGNKVSLDEIAPSKELKATGGLVAAEAKRLHFEIALWSKNNKFQKGRPPKPLRELFAKLTDTSCFAKIRIEDLKIYTDKPILIKLRIKVYKGKVSRILILSAPACLHRCHDLSRQYIFGNSHESATYTIGIRAW